MRPIHQNDIDSYIEPRLITITFKDKLFKHDSGMGRNAREQFKLSKLELEKRITGYCHKMILVAELTKNGNIHYHGLLDFKNEHGPELFTDDIKKSKYIGFIQMMLPNNDQHLKQFKSYMLKDYGKTLTIINKNTKHIDDIMNIVLSSVASIKIKKKSSCLRRWLDSSQGDESSSPSSLDKNIIDIYEDITPEPKPKPMDDEVLQWIIDNDEQDIITKKVNGKTVIIGYN